MSEAARTGTSTRSAQLVAAGIFLSRSAGLVREIVTAGYLGTSPVASVFRVALRLPNILQNLLGEGTLSASFIPVYAKLIEEGREEEAGKVAGGVFALIFALAGALVLIGVFLAPVLVRIFVPGYIDRPELLDLTISAVRIVFPMTGILVLSAWALGILNSHRHFFVSYVAPVLWNAAIIATLIIFGGRLAAEGLVKALAWGALVGGLLQFLVQLPWVLALERQLQIGWHTRLSGVREVVRNAGPAILGRGSIQLSGWIDLVLISFLWAGAASVVGYAQTFYLLPISLFGMSVAAAELPELSRLYGNPAEALRGRLSTGLRRIAFLVIPTLIGYLALGDVIVAGLLQRGDFSGADTLIVYLTLAGFSIGLLAATASRLYSSTFFALRDTRTPAKIAFFRVALNAVLGVALMIPLERIVLEGRPLGVVGLAVGAGIASWIEWMLLRRSLRSRIGGFGVRGLVLARMLGSAISAGLIARVALQFVPNLPPLVVAALILPLYALSYLGSARLLGVEEATSIMARFGRRQGL